MVDYEWLKIVYERVVKTMNEDGWHCTLHDSYSGRSMYGSTCLAISTDASNITLGYYIAITIDEIHGEGAASEFFVNHGETLLPTYSDNLGRDTICYNRAMLKPEATT